MQVCWRCGGCCSTLACGGHLQLKTSATTPRSTPGSSAWASVYQCGEAAVSIRRAWTFCWTSSMWVSGSTSSLRVSCTFPSFNDMFLFFIFLLFFLLSVPLLWPKNLVPKSSHLIFPGQLSNPCSLLFSSVGLSSFQLNHPIPFHG